MYARLDATAIQAADGFTKIFQEEPWTSDALWLCPKRLHITSRQHNLASGWYSCRVPADGSQPSCHLDFWHRYDLSFVCIPSILLPFAVIILYLLWCWYLRKKVLQQFLSANDDSMQEKEHGVGEREEPGGSSAPFLVCDGSEKKGFSDATTDAEAQRCLPPARSQLFKFSNHAFEIWFRTFVATKILMPGNLEQFPAVTALANVYAQQIGALLIEGLIYHPQCLRGALMLSITWLILFLRDALHYWTLSIMELSISMTVGIVVSVYFLVPLMISSQENFTTVTLLSGASLIFRAASPFLNSSYFRSKSDEGPILWGAIIVSWVVPGLSLMCIWSAIDYLKKHDDIPMIPRLAGLAHNFLFEELSIIIYCISISFVSIGFCAATSYLTSCIGLRRLGFGVDAPPDLYDWTGHISVLIWTIIAFLSLLPYMDKPPKKWTKRMLVAASEAVPKTLGGMILLAVPLVVWELWNTGQNVIYPQPVPVLEAVGLFEAAFRSACWKH